MANHYAPNQLRGTIQNLVSSEDPETRSMAAAHLGDRTMRIADERQALDALTEALRDPCATVQEAVLQSLVRLSAK